METCQPSISVTIQKCITRETVDNSSIPSLLACVLKDTGMDSPSDREVEPMPDPMRMVDQANL